MDATVNNINYRLNKSKKTATVDSLASLNEKDIIIPEYILVAEDTYVVKKIAKKAFYLAQIDSVVVPFSLEEIEGYAFWGSSLHSFIRTKSGRPLHISGYAFASCPRLERVMFNGDVMVESCAFENSHMLRSLDSQNIYGSIKVDAFRNCSGLKDFTFSTNISDIQIGAFTNVKLDSATFPDGNINFSFSHDILEALKSARILCSDTNEVCCNLAYQGYRVIPEYDDWLPF